MARQAKQDEPARFRRPGSVVKPLLAGMLLGTITVIGPVLAQGRPGDVKAGVDAWSRGDYATAIREWQAAADKGDADGEFNLAQAYKLGRGVPQDLGKAEALYGKAAQQGHVQAADNLGLLKFQRGDHNGALPYIRAAADRGDPRAQYLLGIALFNGDGMAKDWVRAYALVSLAQQAGLPQAGPALAQMDQYIPLEQRQKAVSAATEMAAQAEANRTSQFAAMDLGTKLPAPGARQTAIVPARPYGTAMGNTAPATPSRHSPSIAPTTPRGLPPAPVPLPRPSAQSPSETAQAEPSSPVPRPRPLRQATAPAEVRPAASGGSWRIQLGAFGVAANADALWAKVHGRPEISGHPRVNVRSGAVTRLLAGGYDEDGARAACRRLSAAGIACIATGN